MISEENALYLTRGDTEFIEINLTTEDGEEYPLAKGDKVYFSVKQNIYMEDYAFQKITEDFKDGKAKITVLPEDTKDLMFGDYVYDVQVTFSGGIIKTVIIPSQLIIGGEVTDE